VPCLPTLTPWPRPGGPRRRCRKPRVERCYAAAPGALPGSHLDPAPGQRPSAVALGGGVLEDLDHLFIQQLGNVRRPHFRKFAKEG
jgi:hypothetical protein